MKLKDRWQQLRSRYQKRKRQLQEFQSGLGVRNLLDSFTDDWMNQAFQLARQRKAPEIEELPADFKLRQSGWIRRLYEWLLPVSHVSRIEFEHQRECFTDYYPINAHSYIGRGSYKFVYKMPWQMVLKVGKPVLQSDPLLGSLYREVAGNPDRFLSKTELDLMEYLCQGQRRGLKEHYLFQFHRLALERYSYWKVREALPDMVLPTRFFMGAHFRHLPLRGHYRMRIRPMDSQIMLVGKHLKEFAVAGKRSQQGRLRRRFFPSYDFEFDSGRFGKIKKKTLLKITEDFRRLITYTEHLAQNEKLILDIHTENLIITLPDFQLKIFDFHLFDEHLYEPSLKFDRPEKDHIEVIERFIDSLALNKPED
ncbi:MAG: hypothetical protein KDK39_04730 [Leptospiraceae bacterium]|nr:hypothetical protein [Leptospiraceae bacterium]